MRLLAFYLPQFHPIPENDEWWGKGFTEWTNVKKGKPLFPGHYQPHVPGELGYYDLRDPAVREAQAALAREYGIYGFCYYHYWFNGKLLLERPFNEVLSSGKPDLPFCLCWANENWTRAWDGKDRHVLISQKYSDEDDREHARWFVNAFKDRRYIRIGGRPLLLIYRANRFIDPARTVSIFREEAKKAGIGEIFLCKVESFPDEMTPPDPMGFDASVQFHPSRGRVSIIGQSLVWKASRRMLSLLKAGAFRRAYIENDIFRYGEYVSQVTSGEVPPYKRFPCVMPGWDNSPRRKFNATIFKDSTPGAYGKWLRAAADECVNMFRGDERIVFINAWNEWGEGNHLEPCERWGRAYLEETRKVSKDFQA